MESKIHVLKNKYLNFILVFLVVSLAFLLRVNRITTDPPSLNWDEVSIGYNAYSIFKTGKDEWGQSFPVHFKSYGEYKLPVQIYASIPGIAVFGLNELGVRVTPVVYGTLTVLVLYFLTSLLFKNRLIGILSALLLAISPWHIQLTRASFESSFSVFWITLGVLFLVKGFKDSRWWIASTIPFILSIYTYNSARVFTPLFLFVTFLIFRKEIFKNIKTIVICLGIFLVSLVPLYLFFTSGEATARLKLVSITDDPGFVLRINEARGNSTLPSPLPKIIHNKVTHFAYVFGKNYLAHFSVDFLFIHGASHKQHHVQGVGELYAVQAPFALIGLIYLFRKRERWRWLIVNWILLAFVPVSVTNDSIPHALRTLIAVVPYQIITAYGFYEVIVLLNTKKIFKNTFIILSVITLLLSVKSYLINYYNVYPAAYSKDWQYGYKQVVGYIKDHYNEYDLIVFSRHYGEPHMFTLFFTNWDPASFQNDPNLIRFETYDWVRVLKFDKFYFPDLGDGGTKFEDVKNENKDKRILFIGKPGDFPENYPTLLKVNFLNGNEAFEIVESEKTK